MTPLRALVLALLVAACAGRRPPAPLPIPAEMAEDRLVILLHGYISSSDEIAPLFDGLARSGPGAYHAHTFDFARFSRVGHAHNLGVETLAEIFNEFYADLPARCAVCRERAHRPVQVTVIARSFGGIIFREALMDESATLRRSPWRIARVINLGTPYFGSLVTRYSTGLLSVLVNGLVRTALFGFVNPGRGGNFGNVVDDQVRALRVGSPYLWDAHRRWQAHLAHLATHGESPPPWLIISAIGSPSPGLAGDGVVRFSSANLAPILPELGAQTMLLDVRHAELFNKPRGGYVARELRWALAAIRGFIEAGTLDGQPGVAPYAVRESDGSLCALDDLAPGEPVRQRIYLQAPGASEPADAQRKLRQVSDLLAWDAGDVWLRFYDGLPGGPTEPVGLELDASLSVFQEGVEWSHQWRELQVETEPDAAGRPIATTLAVGPLRSFLVHLPDVTPTGPWRLQVRLQGDAPVPPEHVRIAVGGQLQPAAPEGSFSRLAVDPLQANLVDVYLDGAAIRAARPRVQALRIREIAFEADR